MKSFRWPLLVAATLASPLISAQMAQAAPAALLTRVHGEVDVVRGGQKLPAKDGFALQKGDRVVAKSGSATVFALGSPPKVVQSGTAFLVGGTAGDAGNSALWNSVYNGLSQGLNRSNRRVAATTRDQRAHPTYPVQTRIETSHPLFQWLAGAQGASRYEVVVTDAKNHEVWRAQSDTTSLAYPSRSAPLVGKLTWKVIPLQQDGTIWKPLSDGVSLSMPFEVASVAQLKTARASLAALDTQLKSASPIDRSLARAAVWNDNGFLDAALRELDKSSTDPTVISYANFLRAGMLQEPIGDDSSSDQKTPIGSADPKILAFKPTTPLVVGTVKTYRDPAGLFTLKIPALFCAGSLELPGKIQYSEFAIQPARGARLSIVSGAATDYPAPGSLVQHLAEIAAKNGDFHVATPIDTTFHGQKALLFVSSGLNKGIATHGEIVEWREKDRVWLAAWGGETKDADSLRPLLSTISFDVPAETAAPLTPAQLHDDLMARMKTSVEAMTVGNQRQRDRGFAAPATPTPPTQEELDALDKARLATPADTHARADATQDESRAVARLAWTNLEKGDMTLANQEFARRTELENESYTAETVAIKKDIAENEGNIDHYLSLTPNFGDWEEYATVLEGLSVLEVQRYTIWRNLAVDKGDTAILEQTSRAMFNERQRQVEWQRLDVPAPDKTWYTYARLADEMESLGGAAQEKADIDGARAYYALSLEWRSAIDPSYVGRDLESALLSRASVEAELGDNRVARDYYEKTMAEFKRIAPARQADIDATTDPDLRSMKQVEWLQGQSVPLNNLGLVSESLGDFTAAEGYLRSALDVIEPLSTEGFAGSVRASMRAKALGNLAVLHADTGDIKGATDLLKQSIDIRRSVNDDDGLALSYLNGAGIDYGSGDIAGATAKIDAARTLFIQLQVPIRVVATDVFSSKLARRRGDLTMSLQMANDALRLVRPLQDAEWLASADRALALALLEMHKGAPLDAVTKAKVAAVLEEATGADQKSGIASSEVLTLGVKASLAERSGDINGALTLLKAAIARFERIRATSSASESLTDLEENYSLYDGAVRLLLKTNQPDEAFDMLSRARSKKLTDSLRLSALKSNDPALQKLLDRAAALDATLAKTRAQLLAQTSLPAPQRDLTKVNNLQDLIASTQAEFFDVSAQIKAKNPRFDKALALSPRELKKAQKAIPEGALLLQYAPLDDGLYIFAVTRDSLKIYEPKVSKDDLDKAIRAYRAAVDTDIAHLQKGEPISSIDTPSPLRTASEQLSHWLIDPVQDEIDACQTVAIVPSGELFYLPFHALGHAAKDGKWSFLIEQKPVAYLAAGDVLAVAQARDASEETHGVLALGDPTGADLPAARTEVESIARLFTNSRALTGGDATKAVLLLPASREKSVLHLAAHGVLDSAQPDQSFIQLSPSATDDGKLKVGEIYGLDLSHVDLVTLSACRTALGEGQPDGSEISSLAESFSSAGTPSVVASLWNVEDNSTARLMESFYGALANGKAKGESLQGAQITLLRDPKTRHPLFWAPFELLGDWR